MGDLKRKVWMGNLKMPESVSECIEECEAATQFFITQHIGALQSEFERLFPDIRSLASRLETALLTVLLTCILDDNADGQTEVWHLRRIQELRWSLNWISHSILVINGSCIPKLCDLAFRHILQFPSTNSFEAAFSQLLHNKLKYRNRFEVKHELRCALGEKKIQESRN